MRQFMGALFLSAFLLAPAATHLKADEHHHDRDDQRYYDPYGHDYHEWNEAEARAYRHWLVEERHREYHDWEHANRRERRDYWRWRHEHMDWH